MRNVSKTSWLNLAGSAAIAVAVLAGGSGVLANAPQGPQDQAARTGGAIQKGRETGRVEATAQAASGVSLEACASGTAPACRAVEAGMAGGLWSWKEGNVTGMDDWETRSARAWPVKMRPRDRAAGGVPGVEMVQRVLAACDAGDVSACAAFAASVQPGAAAQRDVRTYTAGR